MIVKYALSKYVLTFDETFYKYEQILEAKNIKDMKTTIDEVKKIAEFRVPILKSVGHVF